MATTNSHHRKTRFAEFRFYEELNDFLPADQRKTNFRSPFFGSPSVKDTIQAMGVPHAAIDMILIDGQSVGFPHRLRGGERVAVYPVFERLDISPLIRLRSRPLRRTRFILDVHLAKLVRDLRMLGFDATYDRDWNNSTLIDLSLRHERIILTRDLEILKQTRVTHGYWLRHHEPRQQLQEVLLALDLFRQLQPFTRCMDCNGQICPVDKTVIKESRFPAPACGGRRLHSTASNGAHDPSGAVHALRLRVRTLCPAGKTCGLSGLRCAHSPNQGRRVAYGSRERINPNKFQQFGEFRQCQDCRKIYERGSHYKRMLQRDFASPTANQ